ncbi:hypothetical protein FIBSPDRAFT_811551 [Athelia psychrophila]|uniref:DUF1349-domain-containing protein n=1 Tax=Athelia psychrophila TaxID=1759441 RepID=A0A166VI14_9AGAM|nr:hypothetical protein FIBSPDRAFT_811551 [Fibularhizoctonia sp. CBS 109695]
MPSQAGVPISFNDSKWTHLNTPTSLPAISSDGVQITVLSGPKTDWWRATSVDSSSGVVYGFKKGVGDEFEVSVDLGIDHQVKATASDHATVFLRLSSHTWVKAGVEYDLGELWNSVVVTNPYSDWYGPIFHPVLPCSQFLPYEINPLLISDTIQDRTLRVYLGDTMIREVHAFGQEDENEEAFVGVMACSPLGGGVKATFEGFQMREWVR